MKRFLVAAAAAAVLLTGTMASNRADAFGPGSASAIRLGADSVSLTDTVQYVYGGRNYCWYANGWQGPGWYWCGYAFRRGLGWGGGVGWRGWSHGAVGARGVVVRGGVVRGGVVHGGVARGGVVHGGVARGGAVVHGGRRH